MLGAVFGAVFSIIVHKLNLTSGVIPSMGMAMALINFFTVQSWNVALKRLGFSTLPFTPQVQQSAACHFLGALLPTDLYTYYLKLPNMTYQQQLPFLLL